MELVQGSWAKVEALGLSPVGTLFFKRIFEISPESLQLFSFRDEADVRRRRLPPARDGNLQQHRAC